ncbi:MAG TPA: VOC family protein [Polyangiales bacterium]|jgi:catechol 2,3-dioxygenase-like lactoylglutathione lyase family enzyme|nr:VOC family protein [Polyangiales bacterium]
MASVNVRYIVRDIPASLQFYRDLLGFELEQNPGPGFASVTRGELRLLLSSPQEPRGGAVQPMPDGQLPQPGGWNRIQLQVDDLAREVERLRPLGARFRNDVVRGKGGLQILLEDPAGNLVELFELYT